MPLERLVENIAHFIDTVALPVSPAKQRAAYFQGYRRGFPGLGHAEIDNSLGVVIPHVGPASLVPGPEPEISDTVHPPAHVTFFTAVLVGFLITEQHHLVSFREGFQVGIHQGFSGFFLQQGRAGALAPVAHNRHVHQLQVRVAVIAAAQIVHHVREMLDIARIVCIHAPPCVGFLLLRLLRAEYLSHPGRHIPFRAAAVGRDPQ